MQNQSGGLAVKVGIFVVLALVLLIGFSLRVSEDIGGGKTYAVNAFFADAEGLEPGSDISLGGVKVGKIDKLTFDPKRKAVHARIKISTDYQLPKDSIAKVDRSALLGNSVITIKYGDDPAMLAPDGEIKTERVPGLNELVASVTDMSTDARDLVKSLKENQDSVFQKIEGVIEENREDFRNTSKSMAQAGPKLEALADNLNEITANLKAGKGTMGKLYADEELYNDIKSFSGEAKQMAKDVREGQGTLSKLIYDDSLAKKAEESFDKVGKAGDEIQSILEGNREDIKKAIESVGTVGPKIDKAVNDFSEISAKINTGEGTLGKLVNDPSLYNDAKKTMNKVGDSFESSEEQGVIRSFVGILFGALI